MDRNLRIRMLLEAGDKVTRPLRDIAQGSTRAAQALKAARDRLKEMNQAQKDIGAFRSLKLGLRDSSVAIEASRSRLTALGRELAATEKPSRQLTRDFERARREAQKLETQYQANSTRLGELRASLRDAGIPTNELVQHERRLRTEIARTNDEISEQGRRMQALKERSGHLAKARSNFSRMQGNATGMAASGAAGIATGVALGAPILRSLEAAREYESVMTDIAQKADLSRRDAEAMGVGLLQAARAANQLPAALQEGVNTLAGFGLDPRQAVSMMRPIGRAATAYKAEIADLSAAAFAANDNLKVPVQQTGRVIDIMAQAGKAGAFEIRDMAGAFPALTAGYQGLGQTGLGAIADLSAALQIARKGAGDSATAATNLGNIIQKIGSPQTIKAFSKFGVDLPAALKRAYAEGKTPLEAIADLTNKALGGDLSKIGFLFEDAQVQQGLRPLIQNLEEYRRIRTQAFGASGTTDTDFAERMKDGAEKAKRMEVNSQTLAITLGGQLQPAMDAVADKVNTFATWVSDVAQRYPNLSKAILVGTAIFAGLFVVLGGGALVIAGLLAPFSALVFAAGVLGMGLLPVIGITAAIVAGVILLGGAIYALITNWGAIGAWFTALWQTILAGFTGGIAGIAAVLTNFSPVGLLYAGFALLMNWLGVAMPARLTDAGRWLIQGLINGISSKLGELKNTVVNAASSAAKWFKEKLGIRSPSRVFMGFGGHIMEGLARGIAGGESRPLDRLARLSRDMGAAMVLGAATPAIAGAVAGDPASAARSAAAMSAASITYNITVNPAPGMDEAALVKLLERKLAEIKRAESARARSSYRDTADWETA